MGGELLPVVPLQPWAEASSEMGHLLLWTGLTLLQDIIAVQI